MKRKPRLAPRNPLAVLANLRKAGLHGKSQKALRRGSQAKLEREALAQMAEQGTFTPKVVSSMLTRLTSSASTQAKALLSMFCFNKNSGVAQLVESATVNRLVARSSRATGASIAG